MMITRKKSLLIGILFFGIIIAYGRVFLIVKNGIKTRDFYIKKSVCAYTQNKSAVLFVDERAYRNLEYLRINLNEILDSANNQFKAQQLPIRYEFRVDHILYWHPKELIAINTAFTDKKNRILNELGLKIKSARKKYDPDVVIFITALKDEVSAKSFWLEKYPYGNGVIIIDLGFNPLVKIRSPSVKKLFLRGYGQILAHEGAHLYGLEHAANSDSIMKDIIPFGDPKLKFDEKSLNQLRNRLKELKSLQEKC